MDNADDDIEASDDSDEDPDRSGNIFFNIFEQSLDNPWTILGNPWTIIGLSLDNPWAILRIIWQSLDNSWTILG